MKKPIIRFRFSLPEQGTEDSIEIFGTKGKIKFSTFEQSPVKVTTAEGTEEISIEWPNHVHQPLIEKVVAELKGKGKCPSTGETAARTNWVIDKIIRNYNINHNSEQIDLFS
jgi:hypothetical protein